MYIFGVFGTMIGTSFKRFLMNTILKGSILSMLWGAFLLLSENLYILIFGLGSFYPFILAAHTMASQMTALYARRGKSSNTSIYWLFYYFGSSVLGSGTILLHAYSWNVFIAFDDCCRFCIATVNSQCIQRKKKYRYHRYHIYFDEILFIAHPMVILTLY
jgi:YNFM family putative membrane transporter